ncbi:MAG: GNAT family N-acetyltransferase [Thermoflexales bacterium]|nr:GNAT family N-acetyltransferase [Thermoflexales bacterium]
MTNEFVYSRDEHTKDGLAFRMRPANPADAEAVVANIQLVCAEHVYLYTDTFMLTDGWRQSWTCSTDEKNGRLLIVAQVKEEIVGHLRVFPEWYGPKGRHVGDVGVSITKPWRERGIGTAMLAYAFEWAERARFQKLTASVIATNQRALNLFAKFDFAQEGRRARQFNILDKYVDEVLLGRFVNGYNQSALFIT